MFRMLAVDGATFTDPVVHSVCLFFYREILNEFPLPELVKIVFRVYCHR